MLKALGEYVKNAFNGKSFSQLSQRDQDEVLAGIESGLIALKGVDGAQFFVLLLEDPDAPGGTFMHWSVYAIPPQIKKVTEGKIPPHAKQGQNSFGKVGYGPPCPPRGARAHRYVFSVYAVPHKAAFGPVADITAVRRLVASANAKGVLTARYAR